LNGLLKIPFCIFKEEYILKITNETQDIFKNIFNKIKNTPYNNNIILNEKEKYTNIEMIYYCKNIENDYIPEIITDTIDTLVNDIVCFKKEHILSIYTYINYLIKSNNLKHPKLNYSGKKIIDLQNGLIKFIKIQSNNYDIINNICKKYSSSTISKNPIEYITKISNDINLINKNVDSITNYMVNVSNTLNTAIYGHDTAKRHIERIIGQWINGEKSGYCFGFEGPPGIGKTSLAKKGIAHCLKDHNGEVRPFSFIAVGGSANGSTLEGHNYTYVGSTWGRIVDIILKAKCMNPIIFIDEMDKISRTEHGKEIIGILTHLIDPTQNDAFQDKYFSGIDLDLSKALFIFSYNDVESIDRILLDRIHRIKFKHLSLEEKLVITKNYLLPEIYKKIGFENIIEINDQYIVETYTLEAGCRKLKEKLMEILRDVNLRSQIGDKIDGKPITFPFEVTKEFLTDDLFIDKPKITIKKILPNPRCGLVNGLYATSAGMGGITIIECFKIPSESKMRLELTGQQGDVMKESMSVAKTVAYNILPMEIKKKIHKEWKDDGPFGFHIHCPEGATPKDGPSAGAAI
jgi:ATP-dependent Lon protease